MKKGFIAISFLISAALAVAFYFSFTIIEERNYIAQIKNNINELLNDENYTEAFVFCDTIEDEYKSQLQSEIDQYTNELCSDAIDNLSEKALYSYQEAGGDFPSVSDAIDAILATKQHIKDLDESGQQYKQAVIAYDKRQFDEAGECFENVIDDDENYENALMYLHELNVRDNSWSNNATESDYINSCAFDGEYLYVPFMLNGVDGIYKITKEGIAADFFPLSDEASVLYIAGINVVGEYLYFIAGEKVGSGYPFESPYCIYEMKTDGTALALVLEGNFTDMKIVANKIYAISREFGLVEYDRDFAQVDTICNEKVVEFCYANQGIYYTVQGDLTYNSDNTAYFYGGTESIEIDTKEYLHYYQFDDCYVKQWQSGTSSETMAYAKSSDEIKIMIKDIDRCYGLVDDSVIYSYIGSVGQELVAAYNVGTRTTSYFPTVNGLSEFKILNIFYEGSTLVVEKEDKLFLCNASGADAIEIKSVDFDSEKLENNSDVIKHIEDSDIYLSLEEQPVISVIEDKQNWIYKDNELLVVLEKRYVDEYDCNVYVTHVFTNNFSLLTTGNANTNSVSAGASYSASSISEKYDAIYAQSTDAFYYGANYYLGIIIRQGILVRDVLYDNMVAFFDDGHMQVYRKSDGITGQQLLDEGATLSFSFGPILVDDYNVVKECAYEKLIGRNPRSALGYVEPGHYVMVACDGRDYPVSRGLNAIQLAQIFEDEGCSIAYNLDGGQTTTVLFMGNYITQRPPKISGSKQHLHRYIAEIFYVGTNEISPLNLGEYKCDYDYYLENYK